MVLPKGEITRKRGKSEMKSNILKFEVLKEEITAENVLEMSEVIAFAQTRFLIGYMGTRMQKIYAEVYADIKHKKDIRRVLSDGYDLVQEGALYLCEHYGRRLSDVIGYTKKGKAVTIRIYLFAVCVRAGNGKDRMDMAGDRAAVGREMDDHRVCAGV